MFLALSLMRKLTIDETSSTELIFLEGCLLLDLSIASSFLKIDAARVVLVNVGAIQFTLILGANSAAKERVSASIAPFADEIDA